MKICAISDTHSYHRRVEIPETDVLIHAGDITWRGELEIFADFANWLKDLPHAHKIVIFGNHELSNQGTKQIQVNLIREAGAIYLEDNGCEIDGLLFHGAPHTPEFNNWSYNLPRDGEELKRKWDMISDAIHVVISHGPPYGILDGVSGVREPQGCKLLKNRLMQLPNLKAHIFGHLHMSGGQSIKLGEVIFANAAICDDSYNPCRQPIIIEI
jgi:Icc-related predicted phosphoesterase